MQDEINWIPLGFRSGPFKHPYSEDYKCPVCGYEHYLPPLMGLPKHCPKCKSKMENGYEDKFIIELKEPLINIMRDEMNDLQQPYTDPAPGDLVRVVRCKDCRYADKYHHCERLTVWTKADDFCSRGERKE